MIKHKLFSKGEHIHALISNSRYSNIVFPVRAIIYDVKFDDKKKIKVLESSIKELVEIKNEYERHFNKIKRIDSIVQLIEQRTPKGEEEYVESKINRMFNSIVYNP